MKSELRSTSEATPKRVGRYDTFLQLGTGRLGHAYLAAQNDQAGQPQLVVVKVLRREAVEDEHVLALFTDEARLATRLQHPNIVRTREVIAEPPDHLLVTDYQAGHSLLEVLRRLGRQAVPVDEHIYLLTKVLAGLSYAHELKDASGQALGIVHRDLNPANVLVSYTGEIKLIDFGIARASGAVVTTQDGVVRGKVGYAAPEQCLGKPTDPRSDIYSVGVMLWEAIAMRPRSSEETWQSIHQARLDDAEPELEEVCPNTPPALLAIVRKALARDPSDRYAKAREFQRDLEKYLGGKPGPKVGPARVAALLKPCFDQDRVRRQKEIHSFLSTLRGSAAAPPRQVLRAAPRETPAEPTNHVQPTPPAAAAKAMQPLVEEAPKTITEPLPVAEAPKPLAQPPALPAARTAVAGPPPLPSTKLGAKPPPLPPVSKAASPPPLPTASVSLARSAATPTVPRGANALGPVIGMKPSVGLNPVATVSNIPPPPKKSRAGRALFISGAALCLSAVVALTMHRSQQAPAPLPTADASHPAAQKPRPPQVETVRVRISVDPPEAVVRLDGRVLEGNPFTANLPKDTAVHELIASAKGCKDTKQAIHLNQNVDVLVALKRLWNYRPPPRVKKHMGEASAAAH